jgi:uncharacterized protein YbcC (UPF0753/DUF2309 family)
MTPPHPQAADPRERLRHAIDHLGHVLPDQLPILNFVHQNTLFGFQHLPFEQALGEAEKITGIRAFLPEETFRRHFAAGRIDEDKLLAALESRAEVNLDETLAMAGKTRVTRREVLRIALLRDMKSLSPAQLIWRIEEQDATRRFQPDVPESARRRILEPYADETRAVESLWSACLDHFGLGELRMHPEELLDLPAHQAQILLTRFVDGDNRAARSAPRVPEAMRESARAQLEQDLDDLGAGQSLREWLRRLTGQDILDAVRPLLIRLCAAHLDEGLAAWNPLERAQGLWASFRALAGHDAAWLLAELPEARESLADLPEDPLEAIATALTRIGLPETRWEGYLQRVALEIPGWSGMFNWRYHQKNYAANREVPVDLADCLAVRLTLDGLWLGKLCRETWHLPASRDALAAYFHVNLSEYLVRSAYHAGELPEYLAVFARRMLDTAGSERANRESWRGLADMIWTWRHSAVAERAGAHGAWRLFLLAQHLSLSAADMGALDAEQAGRLLAALDELSPTRRGMIWLCAYECHYRDGVFAALVQNHGRGRWARRDERPEAQVIFCMDDREEGIRRHLEEHNPRVETLGAAGFFGVALNWRGLDDTEVTPLCPIVVTPAHEVREIPRPGAEADRQIHDRKRGLTGWLGRLFHQEIRRNLFSSHVLIDALAPLVAPLLGLKTFLPLPFDRLARLGERLLSQDVLTHLALTADDDGTPATPQAPRLGLTDSEQADRVAGLLRITGLTYGFAPLVALAGHGSSSQNNPHLAAYDCGACSGRHGGPNARAFAAMANRAEIRTLLAQRGIHIPEGTWFLGSEHNTCDEEFLWFDLADLPATHQAAYAKLVAELDHARRWSAHERCRRLASAPRKPTLKEALRHIVGRAADFSQARPELGHATNAFAVIGRRSVTQGAFFDRRVFLISYDPTQDPDGKIVEGILLNVGPVGAGINLEYYFSTVNNERFGCGTKVPHNVTGLFGVMEGAASDLRTGLPLQMVEIHEAMRLQLVVEQTEDVLTAIYQRQPAIRELVGNAWLHLTVMHPQTGELSVFEPGKGFAPWRGKTAPLPEVARSPDWYAGHSEPLPPVLIRQPNTLLIQEPYLPPLEKGGGGDFSGDPTRQGLKIPPNPPLRKGGAGETGHA